MKNHHPWWFMLFSVLHLPFLSMKVQRVTLVHNEQLIGHYLSRPFKEKCLKHMNIKEMESSHQMEEGKLI